VRKSRSPAGVAHAVVVTLGGAAALAWALLQIGAAPRNPDAAAPSRSAAAATRGSVVTAAPSRSAAAPAPGSVTAAPPGAAGADAIAAAPAGAWLAARPDYPWSFPRDHWTHPGYRTEWWYFTGEVAAPGGPSRRFGYQLTFFRIGLLPSAPALASAWSAADLVMGHAAITDVAGDRHRFAEILYRASPLLGGFGAFPAPRIAWSRAPAGTPGDWTLDWDGDGFDLAMRDDSGRFGLALTARPGKPLVLEGPNGYSRKGEGPTAASEYASFPRLRTSGTLTLDGRALAVAGDSWMDHEFGSSQLGEDQVGWDWFGLSLDDGRDLMLYLLRDRGGGTSQARGTVVSGSGVARYLDRGDWTVRATASWRSAASGATYPSRWTIEVPGEGLRLDVVPLVADQENRSSRLPDLFYWEGAVEVRGAPGERVGRGYVELTGYGTAARPAI
jgi:predicted secreted hydrolase